MNIGLNYSQIRYNTVFGDFETSTGDKLKFDLKSTEINKIKIGEGMGKINLKENEFKFSLNSTNGISEEDKEEIVEFLKEAKPFIEKFINRNFNIDEKNKIQSTLDLFNLKNERTIDIKTNNVNEFKKEIMKNLETSFKNNYENGNLINNFKEIEEIFKKTEEYIQKILEQIIDNRKSTEKIEEIETKIIDIYG